MESQTSAATRRPGLLDRKITLRWTLIILCVVALLGLILWAAKAIECGRIAAERDAAIRTAVTRSAENVARAIAVVGNRMIVDGKYESLQDCADNVVRGKPLVFIAVVDGLGRAVVHTDRNLLRKSWRPREQRDVVVADMPVMDYTEAVGTVYVGARVK